MVEYFSSEAEYTSASYRFQHLGIVSPRCQSLEIGRVQSSCDPAHAQLKDQRTRPLILSQGSGYEAKSTKGSKVMQFGGVTSFEPK